MHNLRTERSGAWLVQSVHDSPNKFTPHSSFGFLSWLSEACRWFGEPEKPDNSTFTKDTLRNFWIIYFLSSIKGSAKTSVEEPRWPGPGETGSSTLQFCVLAYFLYKHWPWTLAVLSSCYTGSFCCICPWRIQSEVGH